MALTAQSAISTTRQGLDYRSRGVMHHLRTVLAAYHEGGYHDGSYQSGWQWPEDHRFIDQSVCHFFQRWPEWSISHLSNDCRGYAHPFCLKKLDCAASAARCDEIGKRGSKISRLSSCGRRFVQRELRNGEAVSRRSQGEDRPGGIPKDVCRSTGLGNQNF